jgi:tetratricopeptide (TPR) repeat protein
MLVHFGLALLALLPPQADAADQEWNAALTFKQQNKWTEGAAAFEAFSKAHADAPRAAQALLEAGVCWIGLAKTQQVLHRNTPASSATFQSAEKLFARVLSEKPADAVAPRAQYLVGQIALYLGDAEQALKTFDKALATLKPEHEYAAKCLERRAYARRQLLENQGAVRDLTEYLKTAPKSDSSELVRRALRCTQTLDRPAPAWLAEHWALSDPLAPEAYRGDVVVLCFLGSWCDKCAREKEFEKDLKKRFEPLGVRLVGVVQPWQQHDGKLRHTLESFTAFAATSGYGFPLLLDAGDGPGATAAAFGCESLPEMVVIDRAGRVRWHDHPANLLDATLEKLIYEEPPKPARQGGEKPH